MSRYDFPQRSRRNPNEINEIDFESVDNFRGRRDIGGYGGVRWGDEINSALLRPPDYLDEIFVNRRGERRLRWRGLEERGAALAILLQKRRDRIAAKRFFQDVLPAFPAPRKSATGRLRSQRGCQGWHPGARQPQACIRDGRGPRDEARRAPPSAAPRTRAMHAGDGRAEARPSARRALTEFTRNPSETGKWRPSPESASPPPRMGLPKGSP
ncbi:DDE-type integrase/transposase/recombinase [Burkholderia glumae]|uniref:DDE-type integrase/transposase/recombinase n=1 Tax=Burkholderia glumae TaxID=337 RepID=UPI0012FD94E4|nr:hypothetical protein [Burkholderia glumae]QHE12311.1 hypothetical protein GQR88_18075 [Burkholderia glumae AU6208]